MKNWNQIKRYAMRHDGKFWICPVPGVPAIERKWGFRPKFRLDLVLMFNWAREAGKNS